VGSFRFYFDDEKWEWSAEVAEMHGYAPVPLCPTTHQVLSHKHPDDHHQVATTLEHIRRDRATFSTRHRIIDRQGRVRHVVVAGDQLRDDGGFVVGTHGFYIDVSASEQAEQVRVSERVAMVAASRAVIEQAKGMLSVIYDVDPDTAFAILRWRSQDTNTKLKSLAEQLLADFRSVHTHPLLPERSTFDHLLLTVHERVPAD
jgi:PAS domain S-box-containing protein